MPASTLQSTAQQISRTGGFDLDCNPDAALPLFTPEGERKWIKTWNPRPVFPATIEFRRDTVFREGTGDDEALWTILDADRQTHRAEYVRLAPGSHAAHIVVTIEPLPAGRSHVTVSYTVTAFGDRAARVLEGFSESAYAQKMRGWRKMIGEHLASASR